jgi:hypothetical protein
VLAHLQLIAIDGVVPADALTTGPDAADGWGRRFAVVITDARERGLCQPRFPKHVNDCSLGGIVGLAVTYLPIRSGREQEWLPCPYRSGCSS